MTDEFNNVFEGESVLIADDDEFFRELLQALLTYSGLTVVSEVECGKRALIEFLNHRPKLVFLDINMPDMNGLDVLSQIRSISPDTIVFVVSGETTKDNLLKAHSEKADGVIAKPFQFSRVIEDIKKALHSPNGWQKLPSFVA